MIFQSPYKRMEIPQLPLTPFVLQRAREYRDRTALIDGPSGRMMTYGELEAGIKRTAVGLAKRGFRKGDVFAIYSPNLPEYAVIFHAVSLLGGINTTINPLYTADELAFHVSRKGH
jgi:acyl-CoA synthetase (AMP-forming)/AMP-acid ligase II